MVRVPTYSTYINMMNGALKNKQLVDQYSFSVDYGPEVADLFRLTA